MGEPVNSTLRRRRGRLLAAATCGFLVAAAVAGCSSGPAGPPVLNFYTPADNASGYAVDVLHYDAWTVQYAQAGLLATAYFTVAWLAHALAKYAVASEKLAAQMSRIVAEEWRSRNAERATSQEMR